MALDVSRLSILTYPQPVLRARAKPIERITDEVRALAGRMLELMHQAPGVGLAAPQVGLSVRLFVANPTGQPADDRVFINPVLTGPGRELADMEEGCLSLPLINVQVRRPKAITVQAVDLDGQPFALWSEELPARIWQHETDHLDGILIIDRMSPMDRLATQRILRDMEAAAR